MLVLFTLIGLSHADLPYVGQSVRLHNELAAKPFARICSTETMAVHLLNRGMDRLFLLP